MGKVLLLLFTVVPLLELVLLTALGNLFGLGPAILLVLVTGVLGAALAKHEGWRVAREWQRSMAAGRVPEDGVLAGLSILVGGVLLITPGVLTDVAGVLLLVPPTRRGILRWLKRSLERRIARGQIHVVSMNATGSAWTPIIDVEGEEVPARDRPGPSARRFAP